MIRQTLILAILPVAFGAQATCVTDAVEVGDIGPSSELVCGELEHLYPGAALTVEGRSIHSPTAVSVVAAVDGRPVTLRYDLSGYRWRLDETRVFIADVPTAQTAPRMGD